MTEKLIIDIIGWIGSIEVIVAYGAVSYNKLKADSLLYQLLNLTGGLLLIVNTVYYGAYPSTFINIVWGIIAVLALINIAKKS